MENICMKIRHSLGTLTDLKSVELWNTTTLSTMKVTPLYELPTSSLHIFNEGLKYNYIFD